MLPKVNSHCLIPIAHLDAIEKESLPPSAYFHGVIRNEIGVFVVFNADSPALFDIPRPHKDSDACPALYSTSWASYSRAYLCCGPRRPIFDGDLLSVLDIDSRSLPTSKTTSSSGSQWSLSSDLVEKWSGLEGFLCKVVTALRSEVQGLVPAGIVLHAKPAAHGYLNTYDVEEDLLRAVYHSRDVFTPLLAAIALHFVALDGSNQNTSWRTRLIQQLNLQHRLLDSLEECRLALGLLINGTAVINPPIYLFLGKGEEAVKLASRLEVFPSMQNIQLNVQASIRALNQSPPNPVSVLKYVFAPRIMRRDGVFINPEYYETLERRRQQFPPVEAHSGQKEGESFTEFFARRKARKLAEESPKQLQTRLQRENAARSQNCPGRKGARVFMWEQTEGFYIRRLVQRNCVEDEWSDFAPSQRVYDSFSNKWDLCSPLDPVARAEPSDDNDNDNDDFADIYGREAPLQAGDFDAEMPDGLPPQVQSTLGNTTAVLQNLDTYHKENREDIQLLNAPIVDVADRNPVRATLEYRVGFTGEPREPRDLDELKRPERTFDDSELMDVGLCRRFLGYAGSSRPQPLSHAARALMLALKGTKRVNDLPPDLFDLADNALQLNVWSKKGVELFVWRRLSGPAHCMFVYVLHPAEEGSTGRKLYVSDATTAIQVARLRCSTWAALISCLFDLGCEFHIVTEASTFAASSYRPDQYRCRSLGVRPEDYNPDEQDRLIYWDMMRSFLLSPRGRLALQAGGIIARLARLVIEDAELELRSHLSMSGPPRNASIEMNQLDPNARNGHQEKRISWWPQAGAWYSSGLSVGWWTPDCESWFQGILDEMKTNKAAVINNTNWKQRIRGYSAAGKLAKNLEAVHADFIATLPYEDI
ncbi:unnamed protein product [Mycena citricolor]|uniref:Uncharacterized protein n=1 Tax=Mycena citricolor TaxID=2018698 RepID=A0AAD2HV81_9AGAR|nr:unnamed protein product [Mycena citricolor]